MTAFTGFVEKVKQHMRESEVTTFADIPLGEEFYDLDGNLWEKRTERYAIHWVQFEPVERADFSPDDQVRRK